VKQNSQRLKTEKTGGRKARPSDLRQEEKMQYQVKQNKAGKWEAIISNPSFNYSKIFTYETKGGAELRIEIEKRRHAKRWQMLKAFGIT
jgi:hypothetical protein